MTKLDVLDGLDVIRLCVGYRMRGEVSIEPPLLADHYADCEPVYEDMPGWKESTVGVTDYDGGRALPVGLQILGPHLGEAMLLRIARAAEASS